MSSGVLETLIGAAVIAVLVVLPFVWFWVKDWYQGNPTGVDEGTAREQESDRFDYDDMFSDGGHETRDEHTGLRTRHRD